MRIATCALAVVALAGLGGCSEAPNRVIIHLASGWYLRVLPDGSGLIGYGSSGQDAQFLDKGTFRFDDVLKRLSASSQTGSTPGGHSFGISRPGVVEVATRYLTDETLVRELFETCRPAATANPHVNRRWRERPPFERPSG